MIIVDSINEPLIPPRHFNFICAISEQTTKTKSPVQSIPVNRLGT